MKLALERECIFLDTRKNLMVDKYNFSQFISQVSDTMKYSQKIRLNANIRNADAGITAHVVSDAVHIQRGYC